MQRRPVPHRGSAAQSPIDRSGGWYLASMAFGGITVAIAFLTVIWLPMSAQTIAGTPTMIGPHHDTKNFPTVDPVSGTPAEWIPAICQPRVQDASTQIERYPGSGVLFLFPNNKFELPGSTYSAVCSTKDRNFSDPVLLVAQYPSEDPMQLDLANNGFKWYCFAADRGHLFVTATRADTWQTDAHGFGVSPVLEPLEAYGFNVYSSPGP
jgi:hypothetical protein